MFKKKKKDQFWCLEWFPRRIFLNSFNVHINHNYAENRIRRNVSWEPGSGRELSARAGLGKWADLPPSLIAGGLTGNVEPLFACQLEHLPLRCVWLKRLICKALLTKMQTLPEIIWFGRCLCLAEKNLGRYHRAVWCLIFRIWSLTFWGSEAIPLKLVFISLWRLKAYLLGLASYCFALLLPPNCCQSGICLSK